MANYVGARVRIDAEDGSFEGVIKALDRNSKRITLNKVVSCKTGKNIPGQQNFYGNELEKITILEDKPREVKDLMADDPNGPTVMGNMGRKINPSHLRRIRDLENGDLCLSTKSVLEAEDSIISTGRKFMSKESPTSDSSPSQPAQSRSSVRRKSRRPSYFMLIDSIDSDFQAAMKYLSEESIIGMAAEGVNIGRKGELSLLQFATRSHIFIFDILVLGQAAFKEGLTELIQCPNILKILHDCRFVSDLLHHQFGVNLVNIFDSQVADVLAYKTHHNGDLPRYVHGLPTCLFKYLDLSPEEVFVSRVRQQTKEQDESVWKMRPLPSRLLDCATKNVVYLRELRDVLMSHLMAEFTTSVDIYLSVIRDSGEQEINKEKNASHLLPLHFKGLSKALYAKGDGMDFLSDDGFSENCRGVADPWVVFSKGGMFQRHPQNGTANINPYGKVIFQQGSFTSSGEPSPPTSRADTSGVDSGALSDSEPETKQVPRKPKINFKDCPSPPRLAKGYRSPHGHGKISSVLNAKLSPHQVCELTVDKEEERLEVSPEVTEFTQLAQRLVALSTSSRKSEESSASRPTFLLPKYDDVSSQPAKTQNYENVTKSSEREHVKDDGPKLTPNQDPTSAGLNYVFRPAGELEAPHKKTRGFMIHSGYDTDSGMSDGETIMPQHLHSNSSEQMILTTEDYGAIPDTVHEKPKRSLLSSRHRADLSNREESDSAEKVHSEVEAASFISSLQQMVGLKKGAGRGVTELPVPGQEQQSVEHKGRGYMLRPY